MAQTVGMIDPVSGELIDEKQVAERFYCAGEGTGRQLGRAGLTRTVLETALEAEMIEHLGYERHAFSTGENARNGMRCKTVLTVVGAA